LKRRRVSIAQVSHVTGIQVRSKGFAFSRDQIESRLCPIAVPVPDTTAKPQAHSASC
jgi:DNA-binding IclR family transcriptional regulator